MTVDPRTATVSMVDRLESEPSTRETAFLDEPINAGHVIHQFGPGSGDRARNRLNFFFTDPSYRLLYRQKDQELLRGQFGVVYAKSVLYYDSRYRGQATGFTVEGYSKLKDAERPTEVQRIPEESRPHLVAISLVRVMRAYPEFAVFSATYSPDGLLQSLFVDAACNGDWASPSEFVGGDPPINGGGFLGGGVELRPWYGIPPTFPVADYISRPRPVWPTAALPEELTVVHLHYDRNRWIRQDKYVMGRLTSSRALEFPPTSQDDVLESIDLKRGFGRWSQAEW